MIGIICLLLPFDASALQPLSEFIDAAGRTNRQYLASQAEARAAEGRSLESLGAVLPSLQLRGYYTRNQYPVELNPAQLELTHSAAGSKALVLVPANQVDAQARLEIPLIDVRGWLRVGVSWSLRDARRHDVEAMNLDVQRQVAAEYFRLVGAQCVHEASRRRLETAGVAAEVAEKRLREGVVPQIDAQRARATEAHARQAVADAEMSRDLATRALLTLTGMEPEGTSSSRALGDPRSSDEASAVVWEESAANGPWVAAVSATQRSQRLAALAEQASWVPTVSLFAQEGLSNATGFVGRASTWTAGAVAAWRFDAGVLGRTAARGAEAEAARLDAEREALAARDRAYVSWLRVRAAGEKLRAAQAEAQWTAQACARAFDRYQEGAGSQIEFLEAERDAFAADLLQIQSQADLAFARVSLRLDAGQALGGDV